MLRLPELTTKSFLSTRYKTPSLVEIIKSTTYPPTRSDYNFQALRMLSSFSMQNFQEQQDEYRNSITNFTKNVNTLNDSAKTLTTASLFGKKYVSANAGAVAGEAKLGAAVAQYNVGISQIATAQRNEGKTLAGTAYGSFDTGISTFGIKVGGGAERQISVSVLATDNNGQVLKKFASAINKSDTGVWAEVKTKNNMQYLSVTGKNTGAVNSFTLRDITGNEIADLQLNNKVTNAADAQYTVNGTSYQSATNKVSLDNGNVSLYLHAITAETITVNVSEDDSKIVDAVKTFLDNYNDLHEILSDSDAITKEGQKALNSAESLVGKTRSEDFSSIGITLDKTTGKLNLDEKKLAEALNSNSSKVKSLLTSEHSLGKIVFDISKEISNTPISSYLKPPSALENVSYASSYSSNGWMFQQNNLSQGLFLNMTI